MISLSIYLSRGGFLGPWSTPCRLSNPPFGPGAMNGWVFKLTPRGCANAPRNHHWVRSRESGELTLIHDDLILVDSVVSSNPRDM